MISPYTNVESQSNLEDWVSFYKNKKSIKNIKDVRYDFSWEHIFKELLNDSRFNKIEHLLQNSIEPIFPSPANLYYAFLLTPLHNTKVVILGQDPYFNIELHYNKRIPQATGLSFSVPIGFSIPSSLKNIFTNQKINKSRLFDPTSGNLEFWAEQGCLMLNTALTVKNGKPASHLNEWEWFTDEIIKYISSHCDFLIFVFWGNNAYKKKSLIDEKKHIVLASSHPSGLSYKQSTKNFQSFESSNHFGEINKIFKSKGITPIIW